MLITVIFLFWSAKLFVSKNSVISESASRLIFRLSLSTPTSPNLKQVQWLPIRQRIVFKILFYVHCLVHQPGKLPLLLLDLMKPRMLSEALSNCTIFWFSIFKLTNFIHSKIYLFSCTVQILNCA